MRQTIAQVKVGARGALLATGLALGLTGLAGCGSQDATAPRPQELAGTYNLATVDGANLPATVYQGPWNDQETNVRVVVESSTLILDPSGRYALSMQLKMVNTAGQAVPGSVSDTGIYQRNGSALEFTSDNPGVHDYPGDIGDDGVYVGIDLMGNNDPPAYLFRR
jgi:hypothetical protein